MFPNNATHWVPGVQKPEPMADISRSSHHRLVANRIKLRWDWLDLGESWIQWLNILIYSETHRDTGRSHRPVEAEGQVTNRGVTEVTTGIWDSQRSIFPDYFWRNGGLLLTPSLNFQFLAGWKDLFLLFKATKCLVLCMTGCKVSVEWNSGIELYFSFSHFLSQGPFEWGLQPGSRLINGSSTVALSGSQEQSSIEHKKLPANGDSPEGHLPPSSWQWHLAGHSEST